VGFVLILPAFVVARLPMRLSCPDDTSCIARAGVGS
jgi:hypothetical protein